ncbi:MAG: ABC transporter substrate-binding protein [Clostridia bacterium]|nr:ABC transporter substrate-binding protein [Clostridia bacterium]
MKKFLSLLLVLAMTLAFTACSGGGDEAAGDVIKIGVNYELSGGVATYGQSSVDGINLAIEEINAAGGVNGKQIQLVTVDNKSDAAEAYTMTTKLMTSDGVLAVLGPATSGAFKTSIPAAEQAKVPIASGSATADDVTVEYDASGNPDPATLKNYAFRICFNDSYQGTAMAKFAKNNLNATKVALVVDTSSDYGKGLAKNFRATFEADGGTVVAEEAYVDGDTDFNAIITRLAGQEFDCVFIPGYYEEAGLIIKQARAQGINCPILGADGFDSPDLLALAGAAALNDVYFSNHYSSLSQDAVVQNFITAFKAKYDREPDAFNALGYDLAKFVCDAISRAEAETGEAVKAALEATENFAGVTGTFSVDEFHNPVKALVVIGLKDGVQNSAVQVALD